MFSSPPASMLQKLGNELQNHHSPENLCTKIVSFAGALWYVKTLVNSRVARRELLAYLLGKDLVNVAEVRTVSDDEMAWLREIVELPCFASTENTIMVRLANCYSVNDFPLQDLCVAAAGELVFSVWVRRRDAHLYNRAYVENVPIFFDHHVAFGLETYNVSIEKFFSSGNPGYAGAWNIQKRDSNMPLRTSMFRDNIRADSSTWGIHYVDCQQRFIDAARQLTQAIATRNRDLSALISQAGFRGWEAIKLHAFMKYTTRSLQNDVERMLQVVVPGNQLVRYGTTETAWQNLTTTPGCNFT